MLSKVRQALGFARCQMSFYGAAPITAEAERFFLGLNLCLYSGYGLSESSGSHFISSPSSYRLYRCGPGVVPAAFAPLSMPLGAHLLKGSQSLGPWIVGSPDASSPV